MWHCDSAGTMCRTLGKKSTVSTVPLLARSGDPHTASCTCLLFVCRLFLRDKNGPGRCLYQTVLLSLLSPLLRLRLLALQPQLAGKQLAGKRLQMSPCKTCGTTTTTTTRTPRMEPTATHPTNGSRGHRVSPCQPPLAVLLNLLQATATSSLSCVFGYASRTAQPAPHLLRSSRR